GSCVDCSLFVYLFCCCVFHCSTHFRRSAFPNKTQTPRMSYPSATFFSSRCRRGPAENGHLQDCNPSLFSFQSASSSSSLLIRGGISATEATHSLRISCFFLAFSARIAQLIHPQDGKGQKEFERRGICRGKRLADEPMENPAAAKKQKKKVVVEVPQQKEEGEKRGRKKKQKHVPAKSPRKKKQGIGGSEGSTTLESFNEIQMGGKRRMGQTVDNPVTVSAKKQNIEVAKEVQKKDDDDEEKNKNNQMKKVAKELSEQDEGEDKKKKKKLKVHVKPHPKKKQDICSLGKTTLLESLMETVASANKKLPSTVPSNRLANPAGVKRKEKSNTSAYKNDLHEYEEEDNVKMREVRSTKSQLSDVSGRKRVETPASSQTHGSNILYVGNLSYTAEKSDLREFFKDVGKIVDVRVATCETGKYQGRPKGFCHVEFASEAAAQKALELNGEELLGRPVKLDLARERVDCAPGELLGRPMKLDLALERVGCAPEEILGRPVKPELIRERVECAPESGKDGYSHQNGGNDHTQTVLVYGLDKSLDEDHIRSSLQEHFGSCGEITRVLIPKDYGTGGPRGFAYIDFEGRGNFPKALRLNGSSLGSCTLTVEEVGCSSVQSGGLGRHHGESTDPFGGRGGRGLGGSSGGHASGRVRRKLPKPNACAPGKGMKNQIVEPDQARSVQIA
ncbi:hypothetical protein Taro_013112, partial [Colocasia esculenta]|nr:hypothetical protein [Colocasia esculenta]